MAVNAQAWLWMNMANAVACNHSMMGCKLASIGQKLGCMPTALGLRGNETLAPFHSEFKTSKEFKMSPEAAG